MTEDDVRFFMEVCKLVASTATPIVVAIIGILLLRRIEGVKAFVAKQSDFQKRWAEQFFECCQEYMKAIERELALITILDASKNLKDEFKSELTKEISQLHPTISELELRISRSVVFAPKTGRAVTEAARGCIVLMGNLTDSGHGNADKIINKMNDFNTASRNAHAEMLGLKDGR